MELGSLGQWTSAVGTFSAVVIALFKEEITQLWRRPRLAARVLLKEPDCVKTPLHVIRQSWASTPGVLTFECYFF